MKIRSIIVAIVALFAVEANAQGRAGQLSLIPRVGFSITQLTNDYIDLNFNGMQHEIGNRWKPAVEAGIDVEFMILSRLSVTAGAKYSLQGSKFKDFHIEGEENNGMVKLAQFSRFNTDLHYIQVPLMLHAYILKGFSIGAGIQFGSLVSAKESFNYMISDYNKQTNKTDKFYRFDRPSKTLVELAEGEDRFLKYSETVTDAYKGTDMTIPLSISYESEDVILDLRYNIGLGDLASVYLAAGPQFGFNVGSKNIGIVDEVSKSNFKFKDSNLSVNLGAGVNLISHLEIGFCYNIACGKTGEFEVLKSVTDAVGNVVKAKNNSWQISAAYYF